MFSDSARILAFIPTASISHQVVLRSLTQELARRGHEVVVITTDPAFKKDNAPENLREIDLHDIAYDTMKRGFAETVTGNSDDIYIQITSFAKIMQNTFEAEINSDAVQTLIKKEKHFDLLILEGCVKPVLIFSHIFKAPVIMFSSIPTYGVINAYTGAESHPLFFPSYFHQKINNLTKWEKIKELYKHYSFESILAGEVNDMADRMLRKNFGDDIPPLNVLAENVAMVFLAEHHIWDSNRPVPPNVLYVGGIYPPANSKEEISQDLQTYLDSSKHGIIYMSLGTNVKTSLLSEETIQIFTNVFAQVNYDVLLRWEVDKSWNKFTKNVKIVEWVPQAAILKHPNMKLFINQGGLQSTEDAITAGVPMIGMPMLADQWFNVEQAVRLNIGVRLDIESIKEQNMLDAIMTVINDTRYRNSIQSLRSLVLDQPQTALERAIWWCEYVIRHKGAPYLRAPTALISNWDYFEGNLTMVIVLSVVLTASSIVLTLYGIYLYLLNVINKQKIKLN